MRKNTSGFTIVEIIVVIVIIGVLAAITTLSYSNIEANKRDFQRQSNTTVLATSLEKYYTENNEYPSCAAMTGSSSVITSAILPDIDADNLLTPNRPSGETNSVRCGTMASAGPVEDVYAYSGDGSADCNGSVACLEWTLEYREEKSLSVIKIESLHKVTSSTIASTNLTATAVSPSNINLTWTAVTNSSTYALQRSTNSAFTAGLVENTVSGTSLSVGGLNAGTLYYFRIAALGAETQGAWASANATTIQYAAPDAPGVGIALDGNNVVASISPVTCPSGSTSQYGSRSRVNNGTWTGYSAWGSVMSASRAAIEGAKYDYQAQARCAHANNSYSISAAGNEASYIRAIGTPSAPVLSVTTTENISSFVWDATTCPSGTTARYQYKYVGDWGYNSRWYGPSAGITTSNWTTSSQGLEYTVQVETHCYTAYTTSDWSTTGSESYVRAVEAPGAISYAISRADYRTVYMSATSSCGPGVNLISRADLHTWDMYWEPTPPMSVGWYRARFGTWLSNNWLNAGNTIKVGSNTDAAGGMPDGSRWNIAVEMQCKNLTTGRTSASTGYKESATYTL